MNDESTPKGAHEIPAPVSVESLPPSPLSVPDAAWFDGYSSGMDVGHLLGFNAGHVVGWDLGFESGRRDALAEVDAAHSAELDAHNRWVARTIPQAVEARARRVGVST